MRVLLFVRDMVSTPRFPDGDDRPKCVAWWESTWRGALLAVVNDDPFGSVQFHSLNRARKSAARWWLVECENAKNGREAIASGRTELRSGFDGAGSLLIGRILASGGTR